MAVSGADDESHLGNIGDLEIPTMSCEHCHIGTGRGDTISRPDLDFQQQVCPAVWSLKEAKFLATNVAVLALADVRGKSEVWRLSATVSFSWKSGVFLLEDINSNRRAALKLIAPNGFPGAASSQFIALTKVWACNETQGTVRVPEPLADLPSVRAYCTAWIDAPRLHQVLTGEVVSPCRDPVGRTGWWNRKWLQSSDRRLALAAVGHWLASFHSIFPDEREKYDAQSLLKAPISKAIAAHAFAAQLARDNGTFRAALATLTSMADELDGSEVSCTRLHGDAVAHNFCLDDRGVIGFDLAGKARGPAAMDLAKLLVNSQFR